MDKYSREYWEQKQVAQLMEDYGFSKELATAVFDRNWEDHHSYLSDLESCLEDEADYASQIANIVKKKCK